MRLVGDDLVDVAVEVVFPDGLFAAADELGHYLDEVVLRSVSGAHRRLVGERDGVRFEDLQKSGVALGEGDLVGPDLAHVMCLRVRKGRNRDERALLETSMTWIAPLGLQEESCMSTFMPITTGGVEAQDDISLPRPPLREGVLIAGWPSSRSTALALRSGVDVTPSSHRRT